MYVLNSLNFKPTPCCFVLVHVVPSGGGNMVAIDLIVQHVHSQLEEVSQVTPAALSTLLTHQHCDTQTMCHANFMTSAN